MDKLEAFNNCNSNNSTTEYNFKRNFYYVLEEGIKTTNVSFLLGPRKCGKTVALLQLQKNKNNSEYYNFKTLSQEESMSLFDSIGLAIKEDKDVIYLLDEITYAYRPEMEINEIAIILSEIRNSNTKIVFTGSQSVALEAWANRAFCGNAFMLRVDFMNFSEWLLYRGIDAPSIESYNDFLYNVDKFYGFTSLEDYLHGCLEETIISNQKTENVIIGNDIYLVDVDSLLDICYATLFTLHNHVSSYKFAKNDKLSETIQFYFREVCRQLGDTEIGKRISDSFISKYNDFRARDLKTLKQSFLFLYRIGLITITPVSDSVEEIPNVQRDLSITDSCINYKDELFNSYNICIKYPMFYMAILKDILKKDLPEKLPPALLGSIVECNVRGLLTDSGSFEFQDIEGHEIDYVSVKKCMALEITVSNKRSGEINFEYLPEYYKKIVLTRDVQGKKNSVVYIPYYEFIRMCSDSVGGR